MSSNPHRKNLIIGGLIGATVLIIVCVYAFFPSVMPGSSSMSIDPPTVSPGAEVTIKRSYMNVVPPHFLSEKIQVKNQDGKDMLIRTGDEYAALLGTALPVYGSQTPMESYAAFQQTVATKSPTLAGFMEKSFYDGIMNYNHPGAYFIYSVGCPVGLGESNERPPASSTDETSFHVLPGTPAGTYTITIGSDAYCSTGGPTGTLSVTVQ